MRPGLDMKQVLALVVRLVRHPLLSARANSRLIQRGLCYLAENPDVAWARDILTPGISAPDAAPLLLIADKGRVIFSLVLAKGLIGNLPKAVSRQIADIDSLRKAYETYLGLPLQAVLVDAAIIEKIQSRVTIEKDLDPFLVAGREILAAIAESWIQFSPVREEVEMLGSFDGEELLSKFGPRYGLTRRNPVRWGGVLRGLGLALISPLSRWRMKKMLLD